MFSSLAGRSKRTEPGLRRLSWSVEMGSSRRCSAGEQSAESPLERGLYGDRVRPRLIVAERSQVQHSLWAAKIKATRCHKKELQAVYAPGVLSCCLNLGFWLGGRGV